MASTDPLSRLVAAIQPSMPMYLADSGIWSYPGDELIKLAIADAVDDLRSIVDRAGTILREREVATPPRVAYPLSFTGLHDVDLRSLLPRLIAGLSRQLGELDALTGPVGADAAAADLVADAKQSIRQHRDVFEQLAVKLKAGLSGASGAGPAKPSATS
ncbi:MAG: hypothetical protein K8S94_07925 [Planctomycetia bacterium]|nr:hypothetical protein [Planctomycetia bacterium]